MRMTDKTNRKQTKLLALSCQLLARGRSRSGLALNPEPRTLNPSLAPAFTLTELLVVLAVLALIATLAVPAVGPMFASNQTASVVSTIGSMLVTAQATARSYGTPVALRIEQAYKTNDQKLMIDAQGKTPYDNPMIRQPTSLKLFNPVPLDHQQVRMLIFAPARSGSIISQSFQVPPGGFEPVALPKDVWLAPGEALYPASLGLPDLSQGSVWYTPVEGIRYSVLDNFFVVFNGSGELVRHPHDKCYYRDPSQRWSALHRPEEYPVVDHPWDSSLSLIAYDRTRWNAIGSANGAARLDLLRKSVPVYINRHSGSVLEEKR